MTKDDIRRTVLRLVTEVAPDVDPATIRTDRALRDQVELDSYDALNLAVKVSKEFHVDIPDAQYQKMRTVDDLVEHLAAELQVS